MKTLGLATVLALLLAAPVVAATDENIGISIETLLKDGWQIAGYAAANQFAVESTMILLRHADQSYLVQCRASFDVTRSLPQSRRAGIASKVVFEVCSRDNGCAWWSSSRPKNASALLAITVTGPGSVMSSLKNVMCCASAVRRKRQRRSLSRLIKTGVGGLSGPACLPQSDQVAIAYLQSVPKVRDSSTRNRGPEWASLHCLHKRPRREAFMVT
jgi:hypothetical protein